jgi:hypothetical protein
MDSTLMLPSADWMVMGPSTVLTEMFPRTSESDTAVICREKLPHGALQALLLHELTHLFDLGLSKVTMPDWYREGTAEQYGGVGTFTWDAAAAKLTVKGLLCADDLAGLKRAPGTVAEILAFDALGAWSEGYEAGRAGYARCWALVRYLRSAAPAMIRDRFASWQDQCYAEGLGAVSPTQRVRDPNAATDRFRKLLGEHLETLEDGYAAFVDSL